MNLVTPVDAYAILRPYLGAIRDCFVIAWKAWESLEPETKFPLGPRSRATFLNEQICYAIKHRFHSMPGVWINDASGFLILDIEHRLLLRFKKLNDDLRTNNIPTQQQMKFSFQLELPGMPTEATRLVVGYRLNREQTALRDIVVTCPIGDRIKWYFVIDEAETKVIQHPAAHTPMRRRTRVLPKNGNIESGNAEEK